MYWLYDDVFFTCSKILGSSSARVVLVIRHLCLNLNTYSVHINTYIDCPSIFRMAKKKHLENGRHVFFFTSFIPQNMKFLLQSPDKVYYYSLCKRNFHIMSTVL